MILSKYENFILENKLYDLILEENVCYMDRFTNILSGMKSQIAKDLIELIGKDLDITTNYIDITDKDDMVSFYTPSKTKTKIKYRIINNGNTYSTFSELFKFAGLDISSVPLLPNGTIGEVIKIFTREDYDRIPSGISIAYFKSDSGEISFISIQGLEEIPIGKKQESRVGRIATKLLQSIGRKIQSKELEDFVNEFKSRIEILKNKMNLFKLVEGDEIAYWYLESNYDKTKQGTLHTSCMRYDKCQKYLNIYTKNTDVCKLLIFRSESNDSLITGRALVWTLSDKSTFMDRIYYSKDSDVDIFIEYAIKNGWHYKSSQNSSEITSIKLGTEVIKKELTVSIKYSTFDHYPYMDTLKYIDENGCLLSNDSSINHNMYLESTEGGRPGEDCDSCGGSQEVDCYECSGDGEFECDECGGSGEVDCPNCRGMEDIECGDCEGNGKVDGEECSACEGSGRIDCEDCDGDGEVECEECSGNGEHECNNCYGNGRVTCPDCD